MELGHHVGDTVCGLNATHDELRRTVLCHLTFFVIDCGRTPDDAVLLVRFNNYPWSYSWTLGNIPLQDGLRCGGFRLPTVLSTMDIPAEYLLDSDKRYFLRLVFKSSVRDSSF